MTGTERNIGSRGSMHKTYCFPKVPVNKYFMIYQVFKESYSDGPIELSLTFGIS